MSLFVILFYVLLLVVVLDERVHSVLVLYYLILGLLTFAVFAKDKHASKHGLWRVPENALHILSLFGGWTGGVVGQKILRHKTHKQPYKTLFSITIFINIILLSILLFFTSNYLDR